MPGAKGRSGGAREGAGRKRKFDQIELHNIASKAWPKEKRIKTFERLVELAETGSAVHLRILFEYTFGKPGEIESMVDDSQSLTPVLNITIEEPKSSSTDETSGSLPEPSN